MRWSNTLIQQRSKKEILIFFIYKKIKKKEKPDIFINIASLYYFENAIKKPHSKVYKSSHNKMCKVHFHY